MGRPQARSLGRDGSEFGDALDDLKLTGACNVIALKGVQIGVSIFRERLHQRDDLAANARIVDALKQSEQLTAFFITKHTQRARGQSLALTRPDGDALKELRDWKFKRVGDIAKTPRGNAVRSFFVFLHLLKSKPQELSQTLLAHTDRNAPLTHALTQTAINGIHK